ncbi:MFS transporter [Salinispirillum sp. LH 10-3-1]|uniref:MFS transporter n=1 Tax=Salinispirillum sp. LH 10-3-1 TaxID=2952525 RepID=A0AB38YEP2_9GAMM
MSFAREKSNVGLLVGSQILFLITSITVMTLSGVVGLHLAPTPALATLPVTGMMLGALVFTLPASLLMKHIGRRVGFLIGASVGGIGGGVVSVAGVVAGSFWLFFVGSLLFGLYQGFATYYRFAAAEVASDTFKPRALSLVMAGGVFAAFLGPWNASHSHGLVSHAMHDAGDMGMAHQLAEATNAGPYLMLALLAGLAVILLSFLRVPQVIEDAAHGAARSFSEISQQVVFRVALLCSVVGYSVMVLVMTATPLAMTAQGFSMNHIATVMQWHVLGMFAPSFFTGSLIVRFGVYRILLTGSLALLLAFATALTGTTFGHFLVALILLGIGWNFLFIGGSNLLTQAHTPAERGTVQGVNDFLIFALVALSSLLSGVLFYAVGWSGIQWLMLPLAGVTGVLVWWYQRARKAESVAA